MKHLFFFCLVFVSFGTDSFAQHLKPGFDKQEFIEMLKIGAKTTTLPIYDSFPAPRHFEMSYQSPQMGLDNLWQLWLSPDSVAVISIRGTIPTNVSFLANLYAAMVPAKGTLQLEKDFIFQYHLSDDPKAAVHAGYLISTAYLSRDILPKIDSCYRRLGIKEFIIAGHSQGGAITYLLTSYLESLKKAQQLPPDIRFKTCTSAAPKPGNLFYAYTYETLTRGGWAYNVVNTADWVPEVLFSIQTIHDFSDVNPFVLARSMISKQRFPKNIALRYVYNRLSQPALTAQKAYERYLGKMLSKEIKKTLPDFKAPVYVKSNQYVRTGTTIVLYADSAYYRQFPREADKIWKNHSQEAYLFLTQALPGPDADKP